MNFVDYQVAAQRTSGAYGQRKTERRQTLAALALAGEVGEFCNLLKKKVGHGHEVSDELIAFELGDILWYVAELSSAFGLCMDEIAVRNVNKLQRRYPVGFSREASINRED